jgi:hypothetical protein
MNVTAVNMQVRVVQELSNKLKEMVKTQKPDKTPPIHELISVLESNLHTTKLAVNDPVRAIKEAKTLENTIVRKFRRMVLDTKSRLEEERKQRNELEFYEAEAYVFRIIMLLFLIASVGMLLWSYKLEHGEIVQPLQDQFSSFTQQVH